MSYDIGLLRPNWMRLVDVVRVDGVTLPDDCWLWRGACDKRTGYGRVAVQRRTLYMHRVSYETFVGAIPNGLHLDHLCRQRSCCNPAHLEPVTCKTNCERGEKAMKSRCPKGHLYSGENLRVYTDRRGYAHRVCRTCAVAAAARWRAARSGRQKATWRKYLSADANPVA